MESRRRKGKERMVSLDQREHDAKTVESRPAFIPKIPWGKDSTIGRRPGSF